MNCSSTKSSGAIFFGAGSGSVSGCCFVNCSATSGYGGAIYFWSGGSVGNCSFVGCSGSSGGAIYFDSGGSVSGCCFVGCSADSGGAIYFGSGGSVSGCCFVNCSSSGNGGAIYFGSGGSLSVSNSTCIPVVGDEKAPIYNDMGTILSPVVITTLDGKTKDVALGELVNLTGTITTSGMRVTGCTLTIGVNTDSFDVESDVNGLYSVEYTVGFKGTRQVSAKYIMADNQSVICGELACRDDVVVSVEDVSCKLNCPVDLVAHVVGDSGLVTFYVNGVEVGIAKVVDGVAKFTYYANATGSFVIKAIYEGSDIYKPSENTSTLVVTAPKLATSLSASTLTITAYTSKNLVVTLKDSNGKVLSGKKLTITFNGKTYNVTTNASGQAKLSITSKVVKNYTATIKFAGDNSYTASSKSVKVVIKPAYVTVADIIKAAKTLKSYSSKNKKLPSTIKVGSYKLTHAQLTYLMTAAIKKIKAGKKTSTKVKVINVKYTAYNAKVSKKIMKKGYLSVVNTLYSKGVKGTLPKYFKYKCKKIGYNPYAYSLAKILAFYSSKHRLPNYCVFVNY